MSWTEEQLTRLAAERAADRSNHLAWVFSQYMASRAISPVALAAELGCGEAVMPKPLPQAVNISQGVSRGLLIKKVQPVYPQNALAMRVEGSVELMAMIKKTGEIAQLKVLSGNLQLTKAATDAVKQWKYKPYLLNGEPVEIQTQITINFKLPK